MILFAEQATQALRSGKVIIETHRKINGKNHRIIENHDRMLLVNEMHQLHQLCPITAINQQPSNSPDGKRLLTGFGTELARCAVANIELNDVIQGC